jgi:hypothetical protein
MSLPKHDKRNKNAAALSVKQSVKYHSIDETAMTLLEDIKNWGIRLPEELNYVHINSVFGVYFYSRGVAILFALS